MQKDCFGLFLQDHVGDNRLRIISKLKENPLNTNQLANQLGLDYKAIQHHIKVLEKNNMIAKVGEKYAVAYFISTFLEVNMEMFAYLVLNIIYFKVLGGIICFQQVMILLSDNKVLENFPVTIKISNDAVIF